MKQRGKRPSIVARARVARARAALRARARAFWGRDRAHLHGPAALGNRALRIAILALRGIGDHRLGLQAAALTYYTVFSIIPVLVLVLWILKVFDSIPAIGPALPTGDHLPTGNSLLRATLGRILESVKSTSEVTSGVVGLAALLYAVTRLFRYTERALDTIASSERRAPNVTRLLGYLGLLILPPAVIVISGLVLGAARGVLGNEISRLLGEVPGLKLVASALFGLGALWVGLTLFYSAAARARIAPSSASVGGAVAAVALPSVLWAFAEFQIGVSRSNALQSGLAAGPVFLLWVFSSWWVVLIGAEIAVAHAVDRVLIHGARSFRLDALGEEQTGVAIMVRAARASATGSPVLAVDDLARELRLPPQLVRDLCLRLVERGLLAPAAHGFALGCNPDRTGVPAVIDAVARDPELDDAPAPPAGTMDGGPTLRELASEPV